MKRIGLLLLSFFILHTTLFARDLNDIHQTQPSVNIYDISIQSDVKQNEQYGLLISFYCYAIGYKGMPIYFYTYFLYSDYSFIKNKNSQDIYVFSAHTCTRDHSLISVEHFIPYKKLPSKYYGDMGIYIIGYDGFDNLIYQGQPFFIHYSTL